MKSVQEDIFTYVQENHSSYVSLLGVSNVKKIIQARIDGVELKTFSSDYGSNLELGDAIATLSLLVSIIV